MSVLRAIDHRGDILSRTGAPFLIGNDDGLVAVAGQNLVVSANGVGLVQAVEIAFGLVDIGLAERSANVFQTQAIRGERASDSTRIRTAGFWPPLMVTRPTPGSCEIFCDERRIRQIFDLGQRNAWWK